MTEQEIEQAALASAASMGPAENAWVPGVGQIIKDGKLTEIGEQLVHGNQCECHHESLFRKFLKWLGRL